MELKNVSHNHISLFLKRKQARPGYRRIIFPRHVSRMSRRPKLQGSCDYVLTKEFLVTMVKIYR
jgi:hypothetical protein